MIVIMPNQVLANGKPVELGPTQRMIVERFVRRERFHASRRTIGYINQKLKRVGESTRIPYAYNEIYKMIEKLPERRDGRLVSFEHEGQAYKVHVSFFKNGTVGEMFLDGGKAGTHVHIAAREGATMFSIARRYGAPLDVLYAALPKLADGAPAGPLGAAMQKFEGETYGE